MSYVQSAEQVRQFKVSRKNAYYELRSGWLSVTMGNLVTAFDVKFCEDRRFTITTLSMEFPQVAKSVL